ncbi:MAG: hypothetical protein MZU97_11950 [Bacillus subtilis]|nr:hypothetical protein [Bacillus subtilis]
MDFFVEEDAVLPWATAGTSRRATTWNAWRRPRRWRAIRTGSGKCWPGTRSSSRSAWPCRRSWPPSFRRAWPGTGPAPPRNGTGTWPRAARTCFSGSPSTESPSTWASGPSP